MPPAASSHHVFVTRKSPLGVSKAPRSKPGGSAVVSLPPAMSASLSGEAACLKVRRRSQVIQRRVLGRGDFDEPTLRCRGKLLRWGLLRGSLTRVSGKEARVRGKRGGYVCVFILKLLKFMDIEEDGKRNWKVMLNFFIRGAGSWVLEDKVI